MLTYPLLSAILSRSAMVAANTKTMTKFNTISILSLAAGLTFAGSAIAEEDSGIFKGSGKDGAWFLQTSHESAYKALADNATLTIDWAKNTTGKEITFGYTLLNAGEGVDSNFTLGTISSTSNVSYVKNTNEKFTADEGSAWSQDFKKGDLVAIWVKEQGSEDYWYISTTDGKSSVTVGSDPHDGEADTWFGGSGKSHSHATLQFHLSGSGTSEDGTVIPAGGISGGPLPGVWATIALASAAGTYLRRRKNK